MIGLVYPIFHELQMTALAYWGLARFPIEYPIQGYSLF